MEDARVTAQRRGQSFRAFERTKNPGRVIVPVFRDIGFRAGVPGSCHNVIDIAGDFRTHATRTLESGRRRKPAEFRVRPGVNAKTRDLRVISNGYTWKACHPDEARKKCEKGAENRAVRKGGKERDFPDSGERRLRMPGRFRKTFPAGEICGKLNFSGGKTIGDDPGASHRRQGRD